MKEITLDSLRLWPIPVASDGLLDDSRVVVDAGEIAYRFIWELHYRSGNVRRQYERSSGALFQTLWAKLPHEGIERINIHDAAAPGLPMVAHVGVPHDAQGVIYYECDFQLGQGLIRRVYVFGWEIKGKAAYLAKIDPEKTPLRVDEFDIVVSD